MQPSGKEKNAGAFDSATVTQLAEVFRIFGDETRLRILFRLTEREMCVNEISDALGMSISAVSHQLRILRQAQLLRTRRDGKAVIYTIADAHVSSIIRTGAEHVLE